MFFCDTVDQDGKIIVNNVSTTISSEALVAAKDFVGVCCQHVAFVAGRGSIDVFNLVIDN